MGLVQAVRKQMPRLGTRKLYHMLKKPLQEIGVGRDKLFAIVKANHLDIKPKRSYHVTTNSHHRFRKHKNLIADMEFTRPEQVWVSDITYIGNRNNPSYLALVTDAYSKKVVGYNLSDSLNNEGTLNALKMAVKHREYKDNPLIHHSDRGIQYCSDDYQILLNKHRIKCSMTESYDPYANAIAERINGIIKDEFLGNICNAKIDIQKKLIMDSIKIYNAKRPHYSCYMITPDKMHQQHEIKIRRYKKESRMVEHTAFN